MEYGDGTFLELNPGPMACGFRKGRALCPDGKVRAVRFPGGGIPDSFFSIPASVSVRGKTVSGFVTVEPRDGYYTATADDPAVVKFVPNIRGKNAFLFDADGGA